MAKICLLILLIVFSWSNLSPEMALADQKGPDLVAKEEIAGESIQPYLDRVQQKITEFRLENGMKFILLERHRAPVVSMMIYADVGGVDEPDGQTGVAHYLEHLAFKGTPKIGTTNYQAEKPLFVEQDRLFQEMQTAKAQGKTEDLKKLKTEFDRLEKETTKYVKQNEFGKIIEQAGGVGLNAATSTDSTVYFYSLPSNKLELWMSLESERFLDPVFREFYKEKQVILEERRLRTDNSPISQLLEAFGDKAFAVHPYRRPVIGYAKDIENLTRENVENFFKTYYVPSKLTVAIVGDIQPKEVKKLAETYFGRFAAKPAPPPLNLVEPIQTETKEVTLTLKSQPWYLEGYHKPALKDADNAVYEMIGSIMSSGRTSRLYRVLVEQKQVALAAQGLSGYPGGKHPNLMLFYALTAPGHTVDEVAQALDAEINKLKTEPVTKEELDRVKNQAKASLLGSLDSNSGMASNLLEYEVKTGSWRNLFKEIETINAVTSGDILRVAQATFKPENRTIGKLLTQ